MHKQSQNWSGVQYPLKEHENEFNTEVPKLFFTPVFAQGIHLDPFTFEYFPVGISKKNDQKMLRFKVAAENGILVSRKKSRDQNLKKKNIFPKDFFNKIWLKVETMNKSRKKGNRRKPYALKC